MDFARKAQKFVILVLNHSGIKRAECSVCGWQGFSFYRNKRRNGSPMLVCPVCKSKERHRHQALGLEAWNVKQLLEGARILHVAPEERFRSLFENAETYVRIDINPANPDQTIAVCGDLAKASFSSASFDFVYASHVLEHIVNVKDAIAEIYRVLVPGGHAFLDVPTYGEVTKRLSERDHDGHVWHPGLSDWFKQYEEAGFRVRYFPSDDLGAKYGIGVRSPLTLCQKPA